MKQDKRFSSTDYQMYVVKDFLDEFYNKTLFKNGSKTRSDYNATFIKSLFAFKDVNGDYPIGELGDNAQVKRSTMTDMVDRMEQEGLAERVRDANDRRVVKVRLTSKGKRVKREFHKKRREEFDELVSQLSNKEINSFIHHLSEATSILKKIK